MFYLPSFASEIPSSVKVTDYVWAIVEPLSNLSAENPGNNATFGFVVTDKGIVLINSGDASLATQKTHKTIKQSAKIIAIEVAALDQKNTYNNSYHE